MRHVGGDQGVRGGLCECCTARRRRICLVNRECGCPHMNSCGACIVELRSLALTKHNLVFACLHQVLLGGTKEPCGVAKGSLLADASMLIKTRAPAVCCDCSTRQVCLAPRALPPRMVPRPPSRSSTRDVCYMARTADCSDDRSSRFYPVCILLSSRSSTHACISRKWWVLRADPLLFFHFEVFMRL